MNKPIPLTPVPKPIKAEKVRKTQKRIKATCSSELSKLIDRCDILCRSIVKLKAGYKCQGIDANGVRCNKSPVHHHHIIERAKSLITRILIINGIALCDECHDHGNKDDMDNSIRMVIGEERWVYLHELENKTFENLGKSKQEYIEEQFINLKEEFQKLMLRGNTDV